MDVRISVSRAVIALVRLIVARLVPDYVETIHALVDVEQLVKRIVTTQPQTQAKRLMNLKK